MELRSAGIRRLLVVFVCCVFGYIVFYNSLYLDRRGTRLPGRLLFQQVMNVSLSGLSAPATSGTGALQQPAVSGDTLQPGAQPAAPPADQQAAKSTNQPAAKSADQHNQSAAKSADQQATKSADQQPPPAAKPPSTTLPKPAPPPTAGSAATIRNMMEPGFLAANAEGCPQQGRTLQLVILITSAPSHERQRKAIRLTWGGAVAQRRDIALLFFLGRTSETVQRAVSTEQETYGDIVQGNFVDAYNNLTLKSASMLEWLDTYCAEARMILKTDDDMYINTDNLLTFVRLHAKDTNKLFGRVARRWKPIRIAKSKYYLSKEVFPGKYLPDFVTGPAYVLTGDLVGPLYRATLDAKLVPLEDVLVTGIVGDKLGVKRLHASEFINERVRVDTCKFATAISVHMVKFEEQFDIWKRLQDGKAHCPRAYRPTTG